MLAFRDMIGLPSAGNLEAILGIKSESRPSVSLTGEPIEESAPAAPKLELVQSMPRLILVIVCAAVVAVSALLRNYPAASVTGIAAGAVLFLMGIAQGGAVGNAKAFGRRPQDVSTRIGVALAAAGIAAASIGHVPSYLLSFHIFYSVCLAIGCLGAVVLAVRNR